MTWYGPSSTKRVPNKTFRLTSVYLCVCAIADNWQVTLFAPPMRGHYRKRIFSYIPRCTTLYNTTKSQLIPRGLRHGDVAFAANAKRTQSPWLRFREFPLDLPSVLHLSLSLTTGFPARSDTMFSPLAKFANSLCSTASEIIFSRHLLRRGRPGFPWLPELAKRNFDVDRLIGAVSLGALNRV